MKYKVHRAVVIGAGTMGAAIAAHLANAGISVTLLDIVPNTLTPDEQKKGLTLADAMVRNRIVNDGLQRASNSRPASFFSESQVALVKTGNLDDDFDAVAQADWVIEAIVENLEIKQKLMARIEAVRSPTTIVSTNTSGIPIRAIAAGLSENFRQHFLGTHFFNPPRYLKLVEVIATPDTLPSVLEFMCRFVELGLGKGIVLAKDTPNFIGNRIAFGEAAFALDYILEQGFSVDEVDAITGPAIGRPKTATFRLIDLVGVDIWAHVSDNLSPMIPDDRQAQRYLKSPKVTSLIHTLVERGWLGGKTKQGFYKEVRLPDGQKEFWTLNLRSLEYEPPQKVRFESIGKSKDKTLPERLKALMAAEDRAGQLVRPLTFQSLAYASERIPEIADTPREIDEAMRWGFGLDAGPFERWDMLGVAGSLAEMKLAGFEPAAWVEEMLGQGCQTFYSYEDGRKIGVYHPAKRGYEAIRRPAGMVVLKEQKSSNTIIKKNAAATLLDIGDGIACVELHGKMNILDNDTFTIIEKALECAEIDFDGVVIGSESDHFSAGANLAVILMAARMGAWDQIEKAVADLQQLTMKMRYFPRPVIVAPAGYTMGGGAEIMLHASRIVAGAELYTGLVEVGMGLIPAGGGTKEMVRRLVNPPMLTKNAEPLSFLQRVFETVGLGKVSTSAQEARNLGFLSGQDRVVMNRDFLLTEARREALHLANSGYRPPLPEQIYAAGRDALAAMRVGIHMMKEGGYITEYEAHIGNKLAYVMTGGELSKPAWVSEQYILDLEREAFLSLIGEAKTQERIWTFLDTGKRIRN